MRLLILAANVPTAESSKTPELRKPGFQLQQSLHNRPCFLLATGKRQRHDLKEIERAEARICLHRLGKVRRRLVVVRLLDRRLSERA